MLPKLNRIARKKDIDSFFGKNFKDKRGFSFSTKNIIIKAINNPKLNRVGFIVSNKIDNRATVRNRYKRWLRETIKIQLPNLNRKVDLMVVAQPSIKTIELKEIREEILLILNKMKLIK